MVIFYILAVPILLSLLPFFLKSFKTLGRVNAAGHLSVMAAAFYLAVTFASPLNFSNLFYIDALSVFFIFVITVVVFAASLFSIDYIISGGQSFITLFSIYSLSQCSWSLWWLTSAWFGWASS